MKRNFSIILLCVVAVTVLTLFAASKATAFSDEPCYGLNYDYCPAPAMSQTKSPWTITLSEPVLTQDGNFEWNYFISNGAGTITGSNFAAFLIPDCCKMLTDKIKVFKELSSPSNLFVSKVGEGEATLKFGMYNQQAFVVKGTPDSSGNWKIVTNTNHKTRSTIIIKSGNNVYQFEMAVPGCPLATSPQPIGGRTHSECINTGQETTTPFYVGNLGPFPANHDDVSFYIVRNMDRDGCVAKIWVCRGLYCPNCSNEVCPIGENSVCDEITGQTQSSGTILEASLIRSCPDENFSIKTGSPYYKYTFNSGGVTYVYCLDLSNYEYVDPSLCTGE